MHQVKTQQFEGPLDLLLSLIEGQKLDITQIALAEVTEQFLAYVKQLENIDAALLADYLSIAAKLLVIKSRAILPNLETPEEDEDSATDLASRLILYKQFKEAAKYLHSLDNRRKQSFTRDIFFSQHITFFPDPEITPDSLHLAITKVVLGLAELDNLPKAKIREIISIQEKIDHLQQVLESEIETKLSDILSKAKNKPEVIVTFLALLELIKQKILTVEQETLFTDIIVRKYSSDNQTVSEENHD